MPGTYDGNQSLVYVDGVPGDADPVPGLAFPSLSFSAGGTPEFPAMRMEGSLARIQVRAIGHPLLGLAAV
eukprot:scaffold79056_cov35-Prasinocladus_malaysianus.AAC.2